MCIGPLLRANRDRRVHQLRERGSRAGERARRSRLDRLVGSPRRRRSGVRSSNRARAGVGQERRRALVASFDRLEVGQERGCRGLRARSAGTGHDRERQAAARVSSSAGRRSEHVGRSRSRWALPAIAASIVAAGIALYALGPWRESTSPRIDPGAPVKADTSSASGASVKTDTPSTGSAASDASAALAESTGAAGSPRLKADSGHGEIARAPRRCGCSRSPGATVYRARRVEPQRPALRRARDLGPCARTRLGWRS